MDHQAPTAHDQRLDTVGHTVLEVRLIDVATLQVPHGQTGVPQRGRSVPAPDAQYPSRPPGR